MKKEISHIWLGEFKGNAPEDFFEEHYDREDDEPLSAFAKSQGQIWYNHDFIEISYLDEPERVATLVDGHSYSEQYLQKVIIHAENLGIHKANVFVLAYKNEIMTPSTVEGVGYKLWYLGEFECDI